MSRHRTDFGRAALSLRRQVWILRSLSARFKGEYAWIEKAQAHACDVSMIMDETIRKAEILCDMILEEPDVQA